MKTGRVANIAGALAFAVLALSYADAATTYAQAPGATRTVEGRVVNGTPGAVLGSGLTVILHQHTPTQDQDVRATTGPDGRFVFEGIVFDPEALYAVSVSYHGAVYGTDLDLAEGSPPPLTLTVYEAVDDDAVLSVTNASVLLLQSDGAYQTLWALEILKVANGSDRTYVPGPEPMKLLRFGLPEGAHGLSVETALLGEVLQVDRGFALTASVPPGEHQVMYSYQFPYRGTEAVVRRSFQYGAAGLRVLAPHEVARLASDQMGAVQAVTIGERPYQLLTATDLPRGARISVHLRGLTQPSFADNLSRRASELPLEYAGVAGLGLVMVALVGVALWRRGGAARAEGTALVDMEQGRLIREIARVEEEFEAGAITEERYQRRRRELGARLAAIPRRPRDPEE